MTRLRSGSLISVEGRSQQKAEQYEKLYFQNSVPFSDMKISEHTFDRLDVIFAKKPISQLFDNGMKPNLGTGSKSLERNWKIILSHTLSHFQFLKLKFPKPKFYSFDRISDPQPISQTTIDGK